MNTYAHNRNWLVPARRSWRYSIVLAGFAAALAMAMAPASAQLNENCVVSVLNRNVQARADGTWVLPNIPVFQPKRRGTVVATAK